MTGPRHMPSVIVMPKKPRPSPRREGGMISTAIVGPEVVMPPQIRPCTKRVRKNARAVAATAYPEKDRASRM